MPVSRNWRATASRPTAATWSRQGEIIRMPRRAHSSMIVSSRHCLRTVAVFSDSKSWSLDKSRMSHPSGLVDAMHGEPLGHPLDGQVGPLEHAGLVGQAEQFGD